MLACGGGPEQQYGEACASSARHVPGRTGQPAPGRFSVQQGASAAYVSWPWSGNRAIYAPVWRACFGQTGRSTARTYLRQAVADLRALLGDPGSPEPFLLVTPQSLQLDPSADLWLDAAFLAEGERLPASLTPEDVTRLESAVASYRGGFLKGFHLEGCPEFDEWHLMASEQIRRRVETLCSLLAQWREERNDLSSAVYYARRGVELDPLWEEGQCRLIRLLAKQGERAAADHYEHFRSLLAEELGIDPAPTSVALAAQIREDAGPRLSPQTRVRLSTGGDRATVSGTQAG